MKSPRIPETTDLNPPDGGLRAWLQVLGSFFLFFNTWGIINSYGVFQTIYEEVILPSTSASGISWIGSLQSFLIMFLGVVTGPIYDAGHVYTLIYLGSFLVVFGHMMLSLCSTFWQIMLAQSFCIGIGAGLLFVPSIALLSTYFTTKLPFAVGIAASGSSIGGVVYPILIRNLQSQVGYAWSVRVIGFVAFFGLTVSCIVIRVRTPPLSQRKLVDWASFAEMPYTLFNLGLFICFMGLYTPFYYIQSLALQQQLTSLYLQFYLVPIMNAASTLGRIIPGFLSKYMGPFNILVPCSITSGILILCLLAIKSQSPLLVVCVFYGFFSGSLVSLSGPILVALSPDKSVLGTRMGMCFTLMGIALLIGTPISGAILNAENPTAVWLYSGLFTLAGGVIVAAARIAKGGWNIFAKV